MINAISKRLKNKKGFTLVELIVVIAVLGILSAIAVPRFTRVQDEARKTADIATAKSLAKATELALIKEETNIVSNGKVSISELVSKGYLDGEPKPQSADGNFLILVDEKGKIEIWLDADKDNNAEDDTDTKLYPEYKQPQ